jgi:RNA polymerase-binding protein DksA
MASKGQSDKNLKKTFTEEMRTKLIDLKREIFEHLASEDEEFRQILHDEDHKDAGDVATDDIDKKLLETLGAQEQKRLNLIETAMYQIDNGRYGKCISCGNKIPEARLRAIPYALMCLDCKAREERRNR